MKYFLLHQISVVSGTTVQQSKMCAVAHERLAFRVLIFINKLPYIILDVWINDIQLSSHWIHLRKQLMPWHFRHRQAITPTNAGKLSTGETSANYH